MPKEKRIQIEQVDIETGESIEIYPSIAKAAEDNWINENYLRDALRLGGGMAKMQQKEIAFKRVQ